MVVISFNFHRYVPVGLLERLPQRINEKPPYYFGRNDLETLMASGNAADWVRIRWGLITSISFSIEPFISKFIQSFSLLDDPKPDLLIPRG